MTKTLAQIQRQIRSLQRDADTLKAKEAAGVIQRIKGAIAHYQLTAADLFGAATPGKKRRAARKAKAGKRGAAKRSPSPIKFRDDQGNAWTGHGRRPGWYVQAIASGKTPADLAAKE